MVHLFENHRFNPCARGKKMILRSSQEGLAWLAGK